MTITLAETNGYVWVTPTVVTPTAVTPAVTPSAVTPSPAGSRPADAGAGGRQPEVLPWLADLVAVRVSRGPTARTPTQRSRQVDTDAAASPMLHPPQPGWVIIDEPLVPAPARSPTGPDQRHGPASPTGPAG